MCMNMQRMKFQPVTINTILSLLIKSISKPYVLELLNTKQYKKEYVNKVFYEPNILSNLKINLFRYQKRVLHEKFRKIIEKGLLTKTCASAHIIITIINR